MGAYGEWERQREIKRRVEQREELRAHPHATAHQSLFDLQRQAGNHAVSAMLRELAPNAAKPESDIAVSGDQKAEAEADEVADAAVSKLGPEASKTPIIDGTLSPTLRRALGAVAPDVGALDRVRVHTDDAAHAATDSIGARAFTSGHDVSVAKGELRNHREGNRLLAHEAVHAARHQAHGARDAVHAKLRGTRDALIAKGGGETSGKLRKLVHKKTNWDKICDAVGAYEELEAAALKGGNPKPTEMAKITPKLLGQLAKIEGACASWEKANKSDANELRETVHKKFRDENELAESDPRDKAERRQAIALLLPRVRLEVADLQAGKWTQSMGLSDKKKTDQTGKESEGGVNKVKELHYVTESGDFSGYFKEDKGFANKNYQGHEADVGIHQIDPNYGARTVAMYRLDQLLGANVTAKAEFAVHDGKLGTVLESAKGQEASDVKWAMDEDQQKQLGPGAVLTSDPILQKGMNKLQIFDAICGQLDRHQGNWYVDMDPKTGKVRGIKGIDLDMSFGSDQTDPKKAVGENYLGLPEQMDAEFANRLLLVLPQDIRNALKGLLSDDEIESTIRRFEAVKVAIKKAEQNNKLIEKWDEQTADDNREKQSTFKSGHKTYGSQMAGNAIENAMPLVKKAVKDALTGKDNTGIFDSSLLGYFHDIPDLSAKGIRDELDYQMGHYWPKRVLWSGEVSPGQAVEWAMTTLNEVLNDQTFLAKVEVAIQEMDPTGIVDNTVKPFLETRVQAAIKKWVSSRGKQKQKV